MGKRRGHETCNEKDFKLMHHSWAVTEFQDFNLEVAGLTPTD